MWHLPVEGAGGRRGSKPISAYYKTIPFPKLAACERIHDGPFANYDQRCKPAEKFANQIQVFQRKYDKIFANFNAYTLHKGISPLVIYLINIQNIYARAYQGCVRMLIMVMFVVAQMRGKVTVHQLG